MLERLDQHVVTEIENDINSLTPSSTYNRRSFIATSAGAGFAAAVLPVSAQTMITTSSNGLSAAVISLKTATGDVPAYAAKPATGSNFPTVLVVQEIFGVHEHIKDVCRRFAHLGYLAIAPELYHRQGDPKGYTDIPKLQADIVSKVPDAQVMSDLDAAVAWAKANGGDTTRLAVTGFCWGGRITWLYAAHNQAVKAGGAWYGRLVGAASANTPKHPIDLVASINAPILGLYGAADGGIPNDTVEKMREALKAAGKKSDIVLYPNTPHAFHADYRASYRKTEAEDAWDKLTRWFKQNGV
jgi:carboxymethylenebutenolidase